MPPINDFTLGGYKELLTAFSELGYEFRLFHEAEIGKQHIIMRHDVDYCLQYALPVSEIETKQGIRSTYFVLMRSDFYNPLSPDSAKMLRQLASHGHEIGLHFDASNYKQDFEILGRECARECQLLEDCIGSAVKVVSFHRPARMLIDTDLELAGRKHTYQSQFFSKMGYCADSQGRFRYGHPLDNEAVKNRTALQLVIHPVWWYRNRREEPVDRLKRFLAEKSEDMNESMAANSIPFKDYLDTRSA